MENSTSDNRNPSSVGRDALPRSALLKVLGSALMANTIALRLPYVCPIDGLYHRHIEPWISGELASS